MSTHKTSRPRRRSRIVDRPLPGWFRSRPRLEWMEDRTLLSTFTITNTADSGPGSLRQAILDSNSATGATNTIDFDIPGPGVQEIAPLSPLPAITNPVLIDGFSQPGYSGAPLIELSGSQAGGGDGLTITGSGVTVRGLDIHDFSQGAGIHLTGTGAAGAWIYGDFLGTDPTGTKAIPNQFGVEIDGGASDDLIGTDGDGVEDAAERNLISGNAAGIQINGPGTDDNTVAGNLIGTSVTGDVALGNGTSPAYWWLYLAEFGGVVIQGGASDNRIGTDGNSVDGVGERNIIAGNRNDGVDIFGAGTVGNVVAGNLIGTDPTGTRALGNAGNGVHLGNGASLNRIGVNPDGGTALADEGNVISGNGTGVDINGSNANVIAGNEIGTDITGTQRLGNAGIGVSIGGADSNTIGGTTAGTANVISANEDFGVVIGTYATTATLATATLVQGNLIGTDVTGTQPLGNSAGGVEIENGASSNTIGGVTAAAGNLITNNGGPGVAVGSSTSDFSIGNQITANRIFGNTGPAIDLGSGAGVIDDGPAPRLGPNNLQNFPVFVRTADGQIEGALAGSLPDTTFRIEFFASAASGPGGSGEAQVYLGSLEATTDARGGMGFAVPFTAPAGLPILTATATDPQGNTSELSSFRQGTLQVPSASLRAVPNRSLSFPSQSGGGIAIEDPQAGPTDPLWDLTLSASDGTLTLSTTAGLTGSGDGTGSLSYSGPLAALNAALQGLIFNPPVGAHVLATVAIGARSYGAQPLQTQFLITDGVFVVDTTADSGPGSLRQAILDADDTTGPMVTIDFAIPGAGAQTIEPLTPLPAITSSVLIDGTTQPGYAGAPLIALADSGGGLTISGAEVKVRGVAEGGFAFGSAGPRTVLTLPSVPLGEMQESTGSFVINTVGGEEFTAVVQANPGLTARLSLSDAQGHVLMTTDGRSVADRTDEIKLFLPAGTFRLDVQDLGGAGTYSLTVVAAPANPPLQPIPPVISSINFSQPTSPIVVAADFNGDGHLDLATASELSGTISILMGNGDGMFQPAATVSVGGAPDAIVAGDFNGDGKLDLAIAKFNDSAVSILLGNGDGTFQPAVTLPVGNGPTAIVAGDFRGNGILDLAVANAFSNTVSILLGNGDGTFQPAVDLAAGTGPDGLVADDFNGDGKLDLAVADGAGASTGAPGPAGVSILLGNGDGTFQAAGEFAAGVFPGDIVAGDFNGDDRLDLAVTEGAYVITASYFGGVCVLLGNGDGTFQPPVTYTVGIFPTAIAVGNFTGSGHLDLAVASTASSTASILKGLGDGTFQVQASGPVATNPQSIAAGDFNGDGPLELAVVSMDSSVTILLGRGGGAFQSLVPASSRAGPGPYSLLTGDFTGSGRIDLAVRDTGQTTAVLPGNGDGTFQTPLFSTVGLSSNVLWDSQSIVAADFNGDGRLDLAEADQDVGTISVLLGNGDGTFQPPVTYGVGSAPAAILAGDFTGNGRLDLVVANQWDGTISMLLGNGDGTFQPPVTCAFGNYPAAVAAGDFNGDSHLDLAVANAGGQPSSVSILLGNGDGTFQPPVINPVGIFADAVVAGDFNGDGYLDLAVANNDVNDATQTRVGEVSILLGNGDGTFRSTVSYQVGYYPAGIVVGDFAGNGHLDLAVDSESDNTVSVLLGNGDGTFQSPVVYPVGSGPASIVAGDFNGDGRLDLATSNKGSGDVTVLLGNGDGTFTPAGQFVTPPRANALVADINGDGTDDVMVVDAAGNILYRQSIPGQPGSFLPPVTVNHAFPSRDIAWVPRSLDGPLLASVDAHDDAISLYSWRDGRFVRIGSLATGRLPAQIIAADLDGSGFDDLVVRNAGDGTLTVFFNNRLGSFWTGFLHPFLPALTLPVGLGVSDVQAIGTTADDHLDLVVTNALAAQVGVLYNKGDHTFATLVPYRASDGLLAADAGGIPKVTSLEGTSSVAGGPLTPGGRVDLVTVNPGSDTLGVLAGLGGVRFADPAVLASSKPGRIARMADLTGDGVADLVLLTSQGVSVYLGDGKGGFSSPVTYDAGTDPTGLTVADVLGDGRLDILVGNTYGDVLILVGNGDGTFRPFQPVNSAIALAVADLTGDGSLDFVFADQSLNRVSVVYGAPGGKASGPQVLGNQATGVLAPGAVLLHDLNGDGIPDLIVANSGGNNVLVYPGLGDGQFGPPINGTRGFPVGTNPTGLAVAELNGQPDLVVADTGSNDVSTLMGQGKGPNWTMIPGPRIHTDAGPVAVAVGNLLGGTQMALAVANRDANDVQIFPDVGGGFFNDQPQAIRTIPVGQAPSSLFLGNFNSLGQGLATLNAGSNDGTLISLIGTPNPVIQSFPTGGSAPTAGFVGDFTHDGFSDLVVGNNADGHLALLLGGFGGLSLSQTLISPEAPNPTSLSFAGVSDGLLSFYVSTAGREAALHLTFDLEGNLGLESGLPPGSITPTASSSPEAVLSQATTGAVQQVAQLLNLSGTTLDLAATLLTVSVLPGNLESESTGSAAATVGTTGFGQPVLQPRSGGGPGDSDEPAGGEAATPEMRPTAEAEQIPDWERISIGLDRGWERARDAIRELESSMAAPRDAETSAPSPAPTAPRPDPAGRARGSTGTREETPARPGEAAAMSPLPVIDAVLAAWEVRRPEGGPPIERNPAARDASAAWDSPRWPRPLAMIAAGTATLGLVRAWGPRVQGFRRKGSRMIGCP